MKRRKRSIWYESNEEQDSQKHLDKTSEYPEAAKQKPEKSMIGEESS